MATRKFKHTPITAGYPWSVVLRVIATPPKFPEGATLKADVRVNPNSPILATLTTENGGIRRIDDERVEITVTGTQSKAFLGEAVMLDIARTDGPEATHTGLRVRVVVEKPVTRNG